MDGMRDVQMLAQVVTGLLVSHRSHLTSLTALTDSPVSSLHTTTWPVDLYKLLVSDDDDGGDGGTEPGLVVES